MALPDHEAANGQALTGGNRDGHAADVVLGLITIHQPAFGLRPLDLVIAWLVPGDLNEAILPATVGTRPTSGGRAPEGSAGFFGLE